MVRSVWFNEQRTIMDCDPERIWKIVESNRQSIVTKSGQPSVKLIEKLHDCFVDCTNERSDKGQPFRSAVNLLKKVDKTMSEPSLLVNLYEDDKGYSILLQLNGDVFKEIFLPYEEDCIFQYLDQEQIPPIVFELLWKTESQYLHIESIICQVRNFRADFPDVDFLLLHLTSKGFSLVVHELAHQYDCSAEEESFLESRLLLSTQVPLCLDPSTDVACVTNRLCYNQLKFNSNSLKHYLHRRSHANRNTKAGNITRRLPRFHGLFTGHRKFAETWKSRKRWHNPDFIVSDALQEIARLTQFSRSTTGEKTTYTDAGGNSELISNTSYPFSTSMTIASTAISPNNAGNRLSSTASYSPEVKSSKSPPPLSIWHSTRQNRLPKLHPLMNKQKTDKLINSIPMPQLHRMSPCNT